MSNTVILGTARTPVGKLGGGLASLEATELGGIAIKAALERAAVEQALQRAVADVVRDVLAVEYADRDRVGARRERAVGGRCNAHRAAAYPRPKVAAHTRRVT